MRIATLILAAGTCLVAAACTQSGGYNQGYNQGYGYQQPASNPLQTQGGRAIAGAVVGAAAADVLDENIVAGAALGALAGGASCGVAGMPACR